MANSNPTPEHQKLVLALMRHFKDKLGFTILGVDYGDFPKPSKHGSHAPDIVVKDKMGISHLAEAKVSEDLYSDNTREEFEEFSNRVMTGTNVPVLFHIIVYKKDHDLLLSRLRDLGLSYKVGNRIKIWIL